MPNIAGGAFSSSDSTVCRVKTVTKSQAPDFTQVQTVAGRNVRCIVYPAQKAKLNPATTDWALNYYAVLAQTKVDIGELIELDGSDYKIVEQGGWGAYGFYELTAEQVRGPMLVENV